MARRLAARSVATASTVAGKGWRFVGEMREIAATFESRGLPGGFHGAAADLYQRLEQFKDAPEADVEAVVAALREFPDFRSSLAPGGESLVVKDFYHFGIAVDTENGLVVPVVRDVDQKGVRALAEELAALAERARARKLSMSVVRQLKYRP